MLPVYAYQLSVSDFGVLALVQTFTGLASTVLNLSLYTALMRHFYNPPEGTSSRQVFGATWAVLLAFPLAFLLLLGTVGRPVLETLFTSLNFTPFIVMALVIVYCNVAFIETALALARTREEPIKYVAINVGRAVLTTLFVLGLLFDGDLSAARIVGAQVIASLLVAALCAANMWRYSRPQAKGRVALQLVRFSLPLMPLGASQWALRMQDRIVLDKFVDLTSIGVYSMSYRLASPLQILTQAGLRTIMPVMSQAASDPSRKADARRGIGQYLGVAFPVALSGMLLLPDLTRILLPDTYIRAGYVGQWVLASTLAMAVFQLAVNSSALYRGKFKSVTVLTVLGALGNVMLNLVLIPHFGVTGAAAASFISYAVMAVVAWFVSPLPELLRELVVPLVVTIGVGVVLFAVGSWLDPSGLALSLGVGLGLSVLYSGCSYKMLMRGVPPVLLGRGGRDERAKTI